MAVNDRGADATEIGATVVDVVDVDVDDDVVEVEEVDDVEVEVGVEVEDDDDEVDDDEVVVDDVVDAGSEVVVVVEVVVDVGSGGSVLGGVPAEATGTTAASDTVTAATSRMLRLVRFMTSPSARIHEPLPITLRRRGCRSVAKWLRAVPDTVPLCSLAATIRTGLTSRNVTM